jgi:hypothetical protein
VLHPSKCRESYVRLPNVDTENVFIPIRYNIYGIGDKLAAIGAAIVL